MYRSLSFCLFVITVFNCFTFANSLLCYVCTGNGTSDCATHVMLYQNETCPSTDAQCVAILEEYVNRTISTTNVRRFCAAGDGDYCLSLRQPNLNTSSYFTETLCESCDTDLCNSQPLYMPSFFIRVVHIIISAFATVFQYFLF